MIEELRIVPTAAQTDFVNAIRSGQYTIAGFGGGMRGGKTFAALLILRMLCRLFPGSRWAIVRQDLPTLRRTVLPSMKKLGLPEPRHDDWTITLDNGSQILLFPESLDTDPDLERWKGLEVNGFLLEEASEIAEKSYHMAIARAGAYIIPGGVRQPAPLILATFNPSPGWVKHTFYDPWVKGQLEPPYYFRQALARDNPYLTEAYLKNIEKMPEWEYRRYVKGEWDNLTGAALIELDRKVHIIPAFDPPAYWRGMGSFDWGFRHLYAFGDFRANEDGRLFCRDTVRGRQQQPPEIVERIKGKVPLARLEVIHAGHDLWDEHRARGYAGPTLAEHFNALGMVCTQANISRIPGLSALRSLLAWKRKGADASPGDPDLVFMDTPGNQWLFEQLQAMTLDPTSGEDVLKVDADDQGRGGDDGYDMVRMMAASRIAPATEQIDPNLNLQNPESLAVIAAAQRKVPRRRPEEREIIDDPELGGYW